MKKITFLVIASVGLAYGVYAQQEPLGGIFNQKQTQQKLYLQQIAAWEVYLGYLKSGYKTVDKGLMFIHGAKKGEFTLHQNYFTSLYAVNPAIAKSDKIKGILSYQEQIKAAFNNAIPRLKQSNTCSKDEISYIQTVYTNLLQECSKDLDELSKVITPGSTQMTDDERLIRIDKLYLSMQDKYSFAQSFISKAKLLALNRQRQGQEIKILQELYHLN